ncbi:MAG: hypothetical protein GQ470_01590 [Gammaproteobacteria bacterium]|nr:hypothetical protein [Gammaproteobacteria bacterium]
MDKNEVLNKALRYKKMNEIFIDFCSRFAKAFPSGNRFGIEIGKGNPVERELTIFNHPAKIEFGFSNIGGVVTGSISFYRVTHNDHRVRIARIYFNKSGDWRAESEVSGWTCSFKDDLDYTNRLSVIILDGFFNNPIS